VPISLPDEDDTVHAAACGKSHSLILLSNGTVFAMGSNKVGQCGFSAGVQNETIKQWKQCTFPAKVHQIACGEDFSVAVDVHGYLYSTGSSEFGQLGNGATGEYFVTANKLAFTNDYQFTRRTTFCAATMPETSSAAAVTASVQPLGEDIRIARVACGKHHAIAVEATATITSSDGTTTHVKPRVFTWGCGNYGCLGHGVQRYVGPLFGIARMVVLLNPVFFFLVMSTILEW
jgi:alpha-tubulin suppressor-like RCC1 family protein